jgi:hypothetical protein
MQGAVSAFLGSKQAVGIDLTLELGEKGSLSLERRLLGAMLGVHGVGGSAGAKGTLARRQLLTGGSLVKQGWIATLFAHRRGSPFVFADEGCGDASSRWCWRTTTPSLEHTNRTI